MKRLLLSTPRGIPKRGVDIGKRFLDSEAISNGGNVFPAAPWNHRAPSLEFTEKRRRRRDWKDIVRTSEQLIDSKVDSRISAQRIPDLLLEFLEHPGNAKIGPLAMRLLDTNEHPTATMVQMTIEVWLASGHPSRLDESYQLLWRMLTDVTIYAIDDPEEMARINAAFALVVSAFKHDEERVQTLVKRMKELYHDDTIPLQPTTASLNAILNLWARQGNVDMVSNLLDKMIQAQDKTIAPNLVSFNSTVLAYAKRGNSQKATDMLRRMIDCFHQRKQFLEGPEDIGSFVVSFNMVLDAWMKSGHPNAGQRAEEVLQWMNQEQVVPDVRSYNSVIGAYAKSNTKDSALRAEGILRHLLQLREQGSFIGPDAFSFTAVVDGWSRSSSPDSAERAAAVIKVMEDLQDSGYTGAAPVVWPYNALISAWARSHDVHRVQKAKNVLKHMKNRPGIVPNERTYASLITAIVKTSESGVDDALDFLCDMEKAIDSGDSTVKLSTACYNSVLSGLIRSERNDKLTLAEQLLQRMLQRREAKGDLDVSPNTATYNSIMNLWSRSGKADAAERAEALLNRIEDQYQSGWCHHVKPRTAGYVSCITAWARSNQSQKVRRAQSIFRRMEVSYRSGNLDAKPSIQAFNALLNCCSFPGGNVDEQNHATSVVQETLQVLRNSNYCYPDDITYRQVLKAYGRCISPGKRRDDLVEEEFERCCEDGCVNCFVLRELQQSSPRLYTEVFGKDSVEQASQRIPRQWRRNIST